MTTTNGTQTRRVREVWFGMPAIADADRDVILEPCPKRVRIFFAGELIADGTDAQILFERDHPPVPPRAVRFAGRLHRPECRQDSNALADGLDGGYLGL